MESHQGTDEKHYKTPGTEFPALSALEEDFEVFVVTDASGTFNEVTRHSARQGRPPCSRSDFASPMRPLSGVKTAKIKKGSAVSAEPLDSSGGVEGT